MTKTILALGAAAVAFTATPALADRHHGDRNDQGYRHHGDRDDNGYRHHGRMCKKWRHHHCVSYGWGRHGNRHAMWNTGYRFGRNYSYTSYRAIPRVYVQRYDLNPRYRYVYRDNYIYQVDPTTYAVTRVIDALTR